MSTATVKSKKSNPWKSREEYRLACRRENADFLKDFQGRSIVTYIRGPGRKREIHLDPARNTTYFRGNPEAVMVAFKNADGNIQFGFSFKHPTAERVFEKPIGLRKAIQRAEAYMTSAENPYNVPTRYGAIVDEFMCQATERLQDVS